MSDNPRISVIVPVYNTRAYLPACLESVLGQTFEDFELLLVDDGSDDGSLQVEEAYAARDARVRIIKQDHARQGAARNAGLRAARGEYVYFLDSDDVIDSTLLEVCLNACEQDALDFVTFDGLGFVDDPDVVRMDLFTEIRDRSHEARRDVCDGPTFWGPICYGCCLYFLRKSYLLEHKLYFRERIFFEDNDWVLRLFLTARRMRYLPDKLYRYRWRSTSTIHSGFNRQLAESCIAIYDVLLELFDAQQDEARRRIVADVGHVNNARFMQFAELEPDEELGSEVQALMAKAIERARCSEALNYSYGIAWHWGAVMALDGAMRAWPGARPSEVLTPQVLFRSVFGEWRPDSARRVGVYGTGKVCRILLEVFAPFLHPVAFFETEAPHSDCAFGGPLHAISEAPAYNLDALIVASTKFRDQMVDTAQSILGEGTDIVPVHRPILYLEGWTSPEGWGDE